MGAAVGGRCGWQAVGQGLQGGSRGSNAPREKPEKLAFGRASSEHVCSKGRVSPRRGARSPKLLIQGPWQASGPSQALSCTWQMRPLVQGERVRDPARKLSPSLGKSASPRWERSQPPSWWKAEEGTRLLTPSVPATVQAAS